MSEPIDDIENAIERASDVLHNSREWEAEGVYAEYIVPALDRARAAIALATQRAEAAEAERKREIGHLRDMLRDHRIEFDDHTRGRTGALSQFIYDLTAERDALRTFVFVSGQWVSKYVTDNAVSTPEAWKDFSLLMQAYNAMKVQS